MSKPNEKERIKEREKRRKERSLQKKDEKIKNEHENLGNNQNSPAMKVLVRNAIAHSNMKKMWSITILNLFILFLSLLTTYNFYNKPVLPRYVPATEDGKIIPDIPLSEPNMNDGAIMEFALDAVRDINMYDYINWKTQLTNSMGYFTAQGWNSYLLQFENSNTINTVKKMRMIVNMQPTEPPVIIRKGKVEVRGQDIHVWMVEIPAEIKYISNIDTTTKTNTMRGIIRLTIIRTPTIDNPNGVGIQVYQFDTTRDTLN